MFSKDELCYCKDAWEEVSSTKFEDIYFFDLVDTSYFPKYLNITEE